MLTTGNVIRMVKEDTGYGVATLCMVCFVKHSIISINYRDGLEDKGLTSREKKYALKELPGFFSYCNFVFNLQSSVIGPSFEFKDWDDFINLRGDYAKMRPFTNYLPALQRFGEALLCIVVSNVCFIYFPPNDMLTEEFGKTNFAYRILHVYMSMMACIWTYFSGFCMMEANLIAVGFGYTRTQIEHGFDDGPSPVKIVENFNSVRVIKITPQINGTSFADYGTNWNIQIHNWLKYYVMLRLMDRSKPKGAP